MFEFFRDFPIRLQYPELLLLAFPLGVLYWRWGRIRGVTGALRLLLCGLLLLVLTGPEWSLGGRGLDVICVVDRSLSMPGESEARIKEVIHILQENRGPGDRVGIVTFGQKGALENLPSRDGKLGAYTQEIQPDGSDLHDGLQVALNLVDPHRPSRLLVLSDGEANGAPVAGAIRRAQEMGVPIDFREFPRLRTGDLAVQEVLLPEIVAPNEPFQFSVLVIADKSAPGKVIVTRAGKKIAEQERTFVPGSTPLLFRDILPNAGLHKYEVKLEVAGQADPLLDNNTGEGVVRVEAAPRLLVLNQDGQPDNLTRILTAAQLPVDVVAAAQHPLTQDSLEGYRGIIIENIPAGAFGRKKMERLSQFVEDLGGGLLLTGGERSFGTGGYFKSPLEEILPVSMEMRQEHRKTQIAIAIALDRSGSMAVPVGGGGQTKMDLANLGTAECIKLLSPQDSVAVIAVDSSPHIIQPLTDVSNPDTIINKVKRIESMGGGIFVYEALVAAGEQLLKAPQMTKHIILFSDANDSEEPGDYKNLLAKYEKAGITCSVIGLGKPTDVDSKLLEDIAKLGKGNILFSEDPNELPRLFTEDTMTVARSSFIQKDPTTQPNGIPGTMQSNIRLLGDLKPTPFPTADGYNLCYLRPKATLGVVSKDEFVAPWAAFWYRGLGRVAAITLEVDGRHSGQFATWEGGPDFLVSHARWLLTGDEPDATYLKVEHQGQDAVVTLELDPEQAPQVTAATPVLTVVPPGDERTAPLKLPFEWQGATTLQARFPLTQTGTYRPLVQMGPQKFVRGPTLTLPYSPEYAPRDASEDGVELLENLAQRTGGRQRINPLELFADPPRSSSLYSLAPLLFLLALCLLVLEIAGRRWSLWDKFEDYVVPAVTSTIAAGTRAVTKRVTPRRAPVTKSQPVTRPTPSAQPAASNPESSPPTATPPAAPPAPGTNPFELAKRRAQRRR